jgi:predicted ATPase/class 3 adenylate cyclase
MEPVRVQSVEAARPAQVPLYGERRRATVILADVKGSTELAERVDTETWVEIMNHVFHLLGDAIYRYGGEIDQYRGDGLVAFFGAKAAHEDDPERAVRAALAMQDAIKTYAIELESERGVELLLRVGINTGEVIAAHVGDDRQHSEDTAMGRAIALAARMESAAQPGTVLVTADTYHLTQSLFEWQALGDISVKGVSEPVAVFRPLSARILEGKGRGIEGLSSPLVGRDAEFQTLHEAIERLQSGVGGIVTLVGEAGIGKSRLVTELRKQTIATSHESRIRPRWVEGRCLSYGGSIAYLLWLNMLRSVLAVTPDAPALVVRDALRTQVQALCPDSFVAVYPYLCLLMSLPLEDEYESIRNTPGESLRAEVFSSVQSLVENAARQRLLVMVCEDLHWADPTSLELLERLLPLTERTPLLLLCILRPEREHGCWRIVETAVRDYPHRHTDLRLKPLSAADGETLLENLLLSVPGPGGQRSVVGLPEALKMQILSRGDGNPFYVEEILRALTRSGAIVCDDASCQWQAGRAIEEISIPDTLYGVLRARIDQLPAGARHTLQLASVIGRIFSHRLLADIDPRSELDERLVTLQRAQMIRERSRLPEREYIFKHHLTQEAAYNGLLNRERRAYHRQVAEALERLYSGRLEEPLGLLARHWDRAGEPERAVPYLLRAGEQARIAYANEEAITHFRRALAQLDLISAAERPDRSEMGVQTARLEALRGLGAACLATGQAAAAETHFHEAIALGQEIGLAPRERVRLYWWLGETLYWQGRHKDRIRVGEQGLALLGDDIESTEAALINQTIAVGYDDSENWLKCHEITYRTAAFLQRLPYSEELRPAYVHAWVVNRVDKNLERALAWLERLKQEATRRHDLLALHETSHYLGHTWAQVGDLSGALAQVQQALELCTRVGYALNQIRSMHLMGAVLLSLGDLEQAKAYAISSIKAAQTIQNERGKAFVFQLAGRVSLCLGRWEEAMENFQAAAELFRTTGLPFCEARAICHLGRAHLAQGDGKTAANCFQDALMLATQSELEGYIHWSNYTNVILNPLVAEALGGLEETCRDAEEFRVLCRRFRSQADDGPFVQWALEPATFLDSQNEPFLLEAFVETLSPEWVWHDLFADCTYALRDGVEIRAANGRDLLHVNLSAPRLLRQASGDWVVQCQCVPVSRSVPAIGGLVLWKGKENYLRLDRGATGEHDVYFGGCLDNQDVLIGRGHLLPENPGEGGERVFLRLERIGERVEAFCSADGENWFTVGTVMFPVDDPIQVGLHAIGNIDRTIYGGAYPEGTAICFESFQIMMCS